jgi:probable HAF family extracellular repeat protein
MVSLGAMPGETQSSAEGISADGSVIVGFTPSSATGQVFKWTAQTGFVGLGWNSVAVDVSADGSVIAGGPYIWSQVLGRTQLPLSTGHNGLTPDGSVVVGNTELKRMPARWSAATGLQLLGDLPGGILGGLASGVSADGSVVVGFSGSSNSSDEAFRWTADGGMIALGDLAGGDFRSLAIDVTADGSTIVGWSISDVGEEAFYWQEGRGMRRLRDVLESDFRLDLSEWTLNHATAISRDGTFIVGNGTNPAGMREAWIAVIPEPGTWVLTLTGAALLGCGALRITRKRA